METRSSKKRPAPANPKNPTASEKKPRLQTMPDPSTARVTRSRARMSVPQNPIPKLSKNKEKREKTEEKNDHLNSNSPLDLNQNQNSLEGLIQTAISESGFNQIPISLPGLQENSVSLEGLNDTLIPNSNNQNSVIPQEGVDHKTDSQVGINQNSDSSNEDRDSDDYSEEDGDRPDAAGYSDDEEEEYFDDGHHLGENSSRNEYVRADEYGVPTPADQFSVILGSLKDDGDFLLQTAALTQLCDILAVATERSLSNFRYDTFVPVLVNLLNRDGLPDTMLMASRALNYLCDALPNVCSHVVKNGAVPAVCGHLLNIEYIDLAEQSLHLLEKLSHRYGLVCLQNGALMAVLQYIDFFSNNVKAVALATAANACKYLTPETIDSAIDAVSTLVGFLTNEDSKIVENASKCLSRIVDSCVASPDNFTRLSNSGLLTQAANLISLTNSGASQTPVNSSTYTVLIRLMSKCASSSPQSTKLLLEMGISVILKDTLVGSGVNSQTSVPFIVDRSQDQLYDILAFASKLLPSLPDNISSLKVQSLVVAETVKKQLSKKLKGDTQAMASSVAISEHEKLLAENPDLLLKLGSDVFPVIVPLCGASINSRVRQKCMEVIKKLLWFCTPEMLLTFVHSTNLGSFLTAALLKKDSDVIVPALDIADISMQKIPDSAKKVFMKEGVYDAIERLISHETNKRRTIRSSGPTKVESTQNEKPKDVKIVAKSMPEPTGTLSAVAYARAFKERYLGSTSRVGSSLGTECLSKLTSFCAKLNETLDGPKGRRKVRVKREQQVPDNDDSLPNIIAQILSVLSSDDGVSTFEFIRSGVVSSLLNYFSGGAHLKDLYKADKEKYNALLLKRLVTFLNASMKTPGGKESPLIILVKKLQDALASSETFEVFLSPLPPAQSGTNLTSRIVSALSKPLRFNLVKAEDEHSLNDYSSQVLYMRLTDKVSDMENVIWPKVQKIEDPVGAEVGTNSSINQPSQSMNTESQTSASKASQQMISSQTAHVRAQDTTKNISVKDKGKSILVAPNNGTLTRSAARKLEASVKTLQHCGVDSSSSVAKVAIGNASSNSSTSITNVAHALTAQQENLQREALMMGAEIERKLAKPGSSNGAQRLSFFMDGKKLEPSSTLYNVILQNASMTGNDQKALHSVSLLERTFTVTYRRIEVEADKGDSNVGSMPANSECSSFLESIARKKLPCSLKITDGIHDILLLLKVLEGLNRMTPVLLLTEKTGSFANGKMKKIENLKMEEAVVSYDQFVSLKLTSKLNRQVQDVMAIYTRCLPSWCPTLIKACPFLFSFETRRKYFISRELVPSNAFQQFMQQINAENLLSTNNQGQFSKMKRQKVTVSRDNILESALVAMKSDLGQNTVLEFEFDGEVGTGLGPTLEFYTLLSQEFQKTRHDMWRNMPINQKVDDDVVMLGTEESHSQPDKNGGGEFVDTSNGLFPRPCSSSAKASADFEKVKENFSLLGHIMAKSIQDGRLLDLPFSKAFYKLILGQELAMYDIYSFDPELGVSLHEMDALAKRKKLLESKTLKSDAKSVDLCYRDARIEDLCINFTLPGHPDYILKAGGDDIYLTGDNLEEYVKLVVDATIKSGIMAQVEAFRKGFNEVFSLTSLKLFSEDEMEILVCGEQSLWKNEGLKEHIKFDHGYSAKSPQISNFLEIMSEFEPKQQKAFLQFVTGSPRLPAGGLAALNPRLTVVRKNFTGAGGNNSDVDLPSAMTCANYLKLPPYSNKEIMLERLLYAVSEGQGSFHLS